MSVLYAEPLLLPMLPVVGLAALIDEFRTTAFITAERHVELGRLAILQMMSQAVGIVVMVAWALVHPSVWALAAAGIASSTFTTVAGF